MSIPRTTARSGLVSNATKSCNGSVRVLSGLSPAKVIVAPNSPRARAQDKAMPAKMADFTIGRDVVKKVRVGVAPRLNELSSNCGSS